MVFDEVGPSLPLKMLSIAIEYPGVSKVSPNATQSALLSNSAMELAAKGDMAGAKENLLKAITLKPDYGIPHYNLGLILADSGDLGGASSELAKAISLLHQCRV